MKIPKSPWGVRYLGSTDYTTRVTITQPNNGNAADGTPLAATTVACVWANVAQWRGKQDDKNQTLQAVSSYKVIIQYPKSYALDTGMLLCFKGHTLNIESFSDPDGTARECHIWGWEGNATVTQ